MGCDIHIFVEKRINNKWECITEIEEEEDGYLSPKKDIYSERNYSLFGLLAGVRGDAKPIKEPAGLPEDVSEIVKKISDRWNGDGHSHSYYTLEDLLKYDKNTQNPESGYVMKDRWVKFQASLKTSEPDYELRFPFAGWANPELGWEYHEWQVPAIAISPILFYKVIPELRTLGEPENIRIVFWFDN